MLPAKAFDQKTPERLHKSRAIMQSNAVNTFSICAAQTREEPSMKIGIGNDHAAVELKNIISEHLKERGCEVVNFGTDTGWNLPCLSEDSSSILQSLQISDP